MEGISVKKTIFKYICHDFLCNRNSGAVVYEINGEHFVKYTVIGEIGIQKIRKKKMADELIARIKDVYKENPKIFEIEEIDSPPIYDGCGDKYIFSDGKRENMLEADNTWYYEEHREKGSEDTRIVINVIQNIRDILCDVGIERDSLAFIR